MESNYYEKEYRIYGTDVSYARQAGPHYHPLEIRQRVGFSQNDVLSFTESPDGRTVLVKREKLCDDNCKTERAQQRKEETDSVTLFDFLNSLSDEQQCAALYHLSAKWSAQKGGSHAGA